MKSNNRIQKNVGVNTWILLLCFFTCLTYGNDSFAVLKSKRVSNGYTVTDVPNPRHEGSYNWVSNPDLILSTSTVREINVMLSQLEDSLSIEVAVVALSSIGEDVPRQFAHELFEYWGIRKKADNNGLLIFLVLDQREVTFETGYGLEGVLSDVLCYRIQQKAMVPRFATNDFNGGMIRGVQAVVQELYGGDYKPDSDWEKEENSSSFWTYLIANTPLAYHILLIVLFILLNIVVCAVMIGGSYPKDKSALSALDILSHREPYTNFIRTLLLFLIVPFWPGLIWGWFVYRFRLRKRLIRQSKTCDSCKAMALHLLPDELSTSFLSASEQMENQLKSAIHHIYLCKDCGWVLRYNATVNSKYSMCEKCHTIARKRVTPWRILRAATYSTPGLAVAEYLCQMCGDREQVFLEMSCRIDDTNVTSPITTTDNNSSGGGEKSSFGGGHSGGGGASSRF